MALGPGEARLGLRSAGRSDQSVGTEGWQERRGRDRWRRLVLLVDVELLARILARRRQGASGATAGAGRRNRQVEVAAVGDKLAWWQLVPGVQ
jgi:hypothetical protein